MLRSTLLRTALAVVLATSVAHADPFLDAASRDTTCAPCRDFDQFANGAWRSLLNAQSRAAFGPDFLRASLPKAWLAISAPKIKIRRVRVSRFPYARTSSKAKLSNTSINSSVPG